MFRVIKSLTLPAICYLVCFAFAGSVLSDDKIEPAVVRVIEIDADPALHFDGESTQSIEVNASLIDGFVYRMPFEFSVKDGVKLSDLNGQTVCQCVSLQLDKGKVKCAHTASGTVKESCLTISASDAEACPTGSCFTWEHSGCLYYPPVNGTPKSRYLIQENNSAEYDYPVRAATGSAGKETREKPNSRVICFEEYQCSCKELPDGSGTCVSKRGADVVIVEYEVTDKNCVGGVVNTEVPE